MSEQNILKNIEAMAILQRAADSLAQLGIPFILSPMHLPQGMTISLQAAGTEVGVAAAYEASKIGGAMAHSADYAARFNDSVAEVVAERAIEKAREGYAGDTPKTNSSWEHVGNVMVDSAQILLADPLQIGAHWKNVPFEDIRIYQHKESGDRLQFCVDFDNYSEVIPAYGCCMNDLIGSQLWEQVPNPIPPGLNYNSICHTTINQMAGDVNGYGIAISTGYGDGRYPVFVNYDESGRVNKALIHFGDPEDIEVIFKS